METKTCGKCLLTKTLDEFGWANVSKGLRQYYCRDCSNEYARENYRLNKDRYMGQAQARTNDLKSRVCALKTGPCTDCGNRYPPEAMDFDHIGVVPKEYGISEMLRRKMAWSKIEAEIAKCELVCATCHRVRTINRRDF